MKVRIQKLLAAQGIESRRHVEGMVLAGRVTVNGKVPSKMPVMVDPQTDTIHLDGDLIHRPGRDHAGAPAKEEKRVYVLLNKPPGVYCTNVAQGEQTRAIDLLPPEFRTRVYPVGRLDADSRGLLLLTNDGDLTNKLTHPRYGVAKIYRAQIDGDPDGETMERIQQGVWLGDRRSGDGFRTGRARVKVITRSRERSTLELTISEGRNRQVRRMFAALGHKVRFLTRIKLGPLELGDLKPGESRPLREVEVKALYRACDAAEARAVEKAAELEQEKLAKRLLRKRTPVGAKVGARDGKRDGAKTVRKVGGKKGGKSNDFGREAKLQLPMRKQSNHPLGRADSDD